jgi:3-hydroxybutyrate dehydrogenase
MFADKTAIVTGSTSGIGLGIARTLAGAGTNLMLNGFGDAKEIEKLRAALAAEFKVKVGYHGADLSKPEQIRDMVAAAISELGARAVAAISLLAKEQGCRPLHWKRRWR